MGNINDHNFEMKSPINFKLKLSCFVQQDLCILVSSFTSYLMPQGDKDRNDQISGQK